MGIHQRVTNEKLRVTNENCRQEYAKTLWFCLLFHSQRWGINKLLQGATENAGQSKFIHRQVA